MNSPIGRHVRIYLFDFHMTEKIFSRLKKNMSINVREFG